MQKRKTNKGFTLVELLVVIAIVVVLAGALFLVINPGRLLQKSRDAKRFSELSEINKAIASALADQKIALADVAETSSCTDTGGTWLTGTLTLPTGVTGTPLADYMPRIPDDPTNDDSGTTDYCYYVATDATAGTWELNTAMESTDNAAAMVNDGGDADARYEVGTSLTLMTP